MKRGRFLSANPYIHGIFAHFLPKAHYRNKAQAFPNQSPKHTPKEYVRRHYKIPCRVFLSFPPPLYMLLGRLPFYFLFIFGQNGIKSRNRNLNLTFVGFTCCKLLKPHSGCGNYFCKPIVMPARKFYALV